jgi:rhomboid protease GluP
MDWPRNDKRRMCANCRAFITTDDKKCPYCDAPVGMRAVERRATADAMAGFLQGDRFLTNLLLVINVGLYIATLMYSSDNKRIAMDPSFQSLVAFGGKDGYAILYGHQWWRLITAGFLHGGIMHILMNSWVLWDLGPRVDEVFGTWRYIVIYFAATVAGYLASLWWTPGILSIGASAGISGLIGAMVGLGTRERHSIVGAERNRYIQWMLMIVVMGFIISGIDNAAHIGGFAGGFVVAYIAGSRGHARGDDMVWKTLAWVSLAVTGYAFFRMLQFLLSR